MVWLPNVSFYLFSETFFRCQEVIEEVGKNLKTMLQLNTIPVIVHQEREKDALKYFDITKDLNVCHIPFAKTTTKLQELLEINNASLYNHAEAMIKTDLLNLMVGPKKRNFTVPLSVSNPFSKFGIIFIENGVVKREVIFSKLFKRIDFGLFLNDVSSCTKFDPQILNYFKSLELKDKVSIISNSIGVLEQSNSDKDVTKVIQSDLGRFYFKAFATSEYSIENISFYEQVSMYKSMKNSKIEDLSLQIAKIDEMFETFLKPSSIMQLNTTDEKISNAIEKYNGIKEGKVENLETLFDEILGDIMVVLEDTYMRFKISRYHQEYQKSLKSTQTINYLI
jgi:RNAse (barnase) inhibitor barstar